MKKITSWSSPTLDRLMVHPDTAHIAKQLVAGEDLETICCGLTYFEDQLDQGGRRLLLDYCHEALGPCLLARYYAHYGLWSWARGYCPFTEDDLAVLKSDPRLGPLVEAILAGQSYQEVAPNFDVSEHAQQILETFCQQKTDLASSGFSPWADDVEV